MGRTSKFHFPLPGRKHTSSKDNNLPVRSPMTSTGSNLSKAQRFLGTDNDLNIDSPIREDGHSWRYPGSRSSGISISISESTQSTNEGGSFHGSQYEQWDDESGVFPRTPRGKASSTLLGQRYGDDETTTNSDISGRLRNERSSSTLRSYYDRQKSPLSISQQTSNSSARDLALRKGLPPVMQRSPLLQVESVDPFQQHFSEKHLQVGGNDFHAGAPPDKDHRKKPARLDLSMLFPSRNKGKKSDIDSLRQSPSSSSTNYSSTQDTHPDPSSGPKKLMTASSKESLQSQKQCIRSGRSHDRRQYQNTGTLEQLYDHYEHMPPRSARMDQIPESRIPDRDETKVTKVDTQSHLAPGSKQSSIRESYSNPSNNESFSWKNVRESMVSPPWELSSGASVSSRNTRTSRQTSADVLSNSDLKQRSVLSLSSDSEEEFETEPVRSLKGPTQDNNALRVLNGSSPMAKESRRLPPQQPEVLRARNHTNKKAPARETPFLTIPQSSLPSTRLSGPWLSPQVEELRTSSNHRRKGSRSSSQKERRSSKKPSSIASGRSSQQQPTPPLSPTSVEFRQSSSRSSRFMAVTKQEEALLEALRQKRARMREKIIEEHETAKSPPRIPERVTSRHSASSSANTIRANKGMNEKQKVLLYLDTPISESQAIDTAEPSPDLSDFLSFGSDEDSTPRTSWAPPPKGQARPDSVVSPHSRESKLSPMTPPSAVRLSAVGAIGGFRDERVTDQELGGKKRLTGVRFVDDTKLVNTRDFLLDENESEVIWGLQDNEV